MSSTGTGGGTVLVLLLWEGRLCCFGVFVCGNGDEVSGGVFISWTH